MKKILLSGVQAYDPLDHSNRHESLADCDEL
jgi:hypothetical protein